MIGAEGYGEGGHYISHEVVLTEEGRALAIINLWGICGFFS